jgi:hypothetical protein
MAAPTAEMGLAEIVKELLRLHSIRPNWNGLDSVPPTFDAIGRAISVLSALQETWIQPTRVTASAEGGVAITFRRHEKFASVESLNSGEIVLLTSDGTGNPCAREVAATDEALRKTAQDLCEYFKH